MFPSRRDEADGSVRFLQALPHGRLLDVGCGSADWLLSMRELGWEVTGVDLDAQAVRVGRERGLTIHCGTLTGQKFANHAFDAVTLNHVIEHVPDPVDTLRECARILKKGGKLVLFTPNAGSLGHRVFKEFWRGLKTPRHLHIFSFSSMLHALEQAGFREVAIVPWVATSVIYESYLLRKSIGGALFGGRRRRLGIGVAGLFGVMERLLIKWKPSMADCLAVITVKW